MSKNDVLFLCQFFYPENVSSATLPFDTASALVKSGFSVGALCGYPKEYVSEKNVATKEVKDGVEIRRTANENNVTLFTSLDTVRVLLDVLEEITLTISTIDA